MLRSILVAALFVSALVVGSCSDSTEPDLERPGPPAAGGEPTPGQLAAAETALTAATLEFGLKLFRKVAAEAEPTENVFISPLSVSYALTMAGNGAAGETEEAFAEVMGTEGLSREAVNRKIAEITTRLANADSDVRFSAANSIWSNTGKGLVPDYVALCEQYLDAVAREMNFQDSRTADTINNWVAEKTNDKITEIIQASELSRLVLLLLNAIYFNANWTYPFDSSLIRTEPFHLADGSTKDCQMMWRDLTEDAAFFENFADRPIYYFSDGGYASPGTVKGVTLHYGSDGFYMTLLMPDTSRTVDEFVESFTVDNWNGWQDLGRQSSFDFAMPKFKFAYDIDLTGILADMGLGIAFDAARADFSNMFVDGEGWIDFVKHKTFIQVDEHGTEAAAVTSVGYVTSIPPSFIANRPFVLVVHERSSGVILFLGRIADPVWES
jgi:serpin B